MIASGYNTIQSFVDIYQEQHNYEWPLYKDPSNEKKPKKPPAEQVGLRTLTEKMKPLGIQHVKARYIVVAAAIVDIYHGRILPDNPAILIRFPGAAWKTVNIFMNEYHEKPIGIGCDTHVFRDLCSEFRWANPSKTRDTDYCRLQVEKWMGKSQCSKINHVCGAFAQWQNGLNDESAWEILQYAYCDSLFRMNDMVKDFVLCKLGPKAYNHGHNFGMNEEAIPGYKGITRLVDTLESSDPNFTLRAKLREQRDAMTNNIHMNYSFHALKWNY